MLLLRYIFSFLTVQNLPMALVALTAILVVPPSNPRSPYHVYSLQKRVVSSPIPQITRTVRPRRAQPNIVAIKSPSGIFFEVDHFDLEYTIKPLPAKAPACTDLRSEATISLRPINHRSIISQFASGFQSTRASPLRI